MNWSLSGLSDQRLLDAAGEADRLSLGAHEGGRVVGAVAGDAVTAEVLNRLGRS